MDRQGESLATEGTEFTERFFLVPSTIQPPLQPDFFQIGKDLYLCVLGDLCGKNRLTGARPKISLGRYAGSPGPDGEDSRRGRTGVLGGGGRYLGAVVCNWLGLLKRNI